MTKNIDILVDTNFGDNGKARIADYLTNNYTAVAKWNGGPNAGGQIQIKDQKIVLHQLPSGVMHPNVNLYLGAQMYIDPKGLYEEIEQVEKLGINVYDRLFISYNAHVISQSHQERDIQNESTSKAVGSTKKGIAPCASDKYARNGARIEHLTDARYSKIRARVFRDISKRINKEQSVLCVGANGTFIDIDWGTYPYVTSSSTLAQSALVSLAQSPFKLNKIIGVTKAYATRVGNGPFETELFDHNGVYLRQNGHEYGSTTGRPRRCGWLDLDALIEAVEMNGITELALTKLDVLSGLPQIGIKYQNQVQMLNGWDEDISGVRSWDDLPHNAKFYLNFIEKSINQKGYGPSGKVPLLHISVGPERSQIILNY